MTDKNKHNTNAITHQILEELSEQDIQTINGGVKFGIPQKMLDAHASMSPSSSSGSYGTRQLFEEHEVPPTKQSGMLDKLTSNHAKVFSAQVGGGALGSFVVGTASGK
jgi:hypothetical protein